MHIDLHLHRKGTFRGGRTSTWTMCFGGAGDFYSGTGRHFLLVFLQTPVLWGVGWASIWTGKWFTWSGLTKDIGPPKSSGYRGGWGERGAGYLAAALEVALRGGDALPLRLRLRRPPRCMDQPLRPQASKKPPTVRIEASETIPRPLPLPPSPQRKWEGRAFGNQSGQNGR